MRKFFSTLAVWGALGTTGLAYNPGDYNLDYETDTADYVVWRAREAQQSGYDAWRVDYGNQPGGGCDPCIEPPEPLATGCAPEPNGGLLVLVGLGLIAGTRRRR